MKDVPSQFREYLRLDRLRRHEGLAISDLERWKLLKRSLGKHFSPGISDERADQRESVRVPAQLRVSFASERELAESLTANLSRKGLFVRTDAVFELGTRLEVCIHLEQPSRQLVLRAEVVSQHSSSERSDGPGVGMRFLDMPPDVEKQLEDMYERLAR
jgi:uncharacterized protein (TIGR02266 family)